ncbi:MAG: hypothetical protein M3N47_09350, partial [Chloroflexota bacterium]|nr:hypothetical protein [Chloroflexota bacterium]
MPATVKLQPATNHPAPTPASDRPTLTLADLEAHAPHATARGAERRFLCPLPACRDKQRGVRHRSLAVNVDSGAWMCHRCQASG